MMLYGIDYPNLGLFRYLQSLTGKIFKILPLYESSAPDSKKYILNFLRELLGFCELVSVVGNDSDFVAMIATIRGIADIDDDCQSVKSDVFKAIRLCESVRARYFAEFDVEVQ